MKCRAGRLAALVVGTLATGMWSGCSLENPGAPALTAPSEFGTSVTLTAFPDQVPRDGSAQSTVTATVRDASNRPVAGQLLNVSSSIGTVSQDKVVTGSDGRVSFSFTAPPPGTVGNAALILVTLVGSGGDAPVPRVVTIAFTGASNTTGPTACFTVDPESPQVRQIVTFDASKTTDEGPPPPGCTRVSLPPPNPCGSGCRYSWNFDDGTSGTGQVITHRFDVARSHTVTLTVTDAAGTVASLSRVVTVDAVAAPTVTLFEVLPEEPIAGQQATFRATATAGAGHSIQTYAWDFGDGTTQTTTSPTVTKTYGTPGTYTATVTATDDLGQTGSFSITVTVGSAITFPDTIPFTVSPTSPKVGESVIFSGADVTSKNGATITEFTWDFGDGSATVTASGPTTTHEFTRAGTFVVRLTVRNSQGQTGTAIRNVPVTAAP